MRFLNDRIHGAMDYAAGVVLVLAPFLLDFQAVNPLAHWLSVIVGATLIAYSLITRYSLSVRKMIPFPVHLVFDTSAGVLFLLAPLLFGFVDVIRGYYFVMGAAVLLLVLVTNPRSVPESIERRHDQPVTGRI